MKSTLLISVLCLLLFSCDNAEQYNNIKGKWQCYEWIVPTGENLCNSRTVAFDFKENKTYTYIHGPLTEQGVYRISGQSLYSKPDGKLEIGVRIKQLTPDTLQLIMSRSGDKEVLTLLKLNE